MSAIKVHVTLDDFVTADPAALAKKAVEIERLAGIKDTDQKRLMKYGVLTGTMDGARLDAVKAVRGVIDVRTEP